MAVSIDHSKKATLVTGGGAGIGKEIALWMAKAGSDIAIIDRREDVMRQTLGEIEALGVKAYGVAGDARDDDRLVEMIGESCNLLGGLDFAVNNIGMLGTEGSARWLEMSPKQFRDAVEQNLIITGIACQAEAKIMAKLSETASIKTDIRANDGVIINVSSGETTRPALGLAGYGSAKAGINHLTQTLAAELGPYGIRVNAVAPGTTRTEQVKAAFSDEQYQTFVDATPLKRETYPEELARLIVFLTSDLARCITGQTILADAGAHLSRSRPSSDD